MEANREIDLEERKAEQRDMKEMIKMMAARLEKTDASHKEILAETKPERDMETMACREMTEARLEEEKPTTVNRKPEAAEQREVPVEDAEVMPVGEPKKKRRMVQKLAAECCCQMNQWTQYQHGCQRKGLAVARRRTSHHAKVAKTGRKSKETDRMMSGRPRIAWRKRSIGKRNCTRTKYEERIRKLREREQILHKGRTGIKNIYRQTAAKPEEKGANQERHRRV
jgi:hypothetical protein